MPRFLGVIPARYASTRFPGKPLAPLNDRSLVEEVWRRARRSEKIDRLIVATEDARIVDAVGAFGAEAMLTDAAHPSGTDRAAEVSRRVASEDGGEHDVVINIQGDEPMITPTSLDRLAGAFETDPGTRMATLAEPIDSVEELFDPNVVKVVTARDGRALYFSRLPIPYHRGNAARLKLDFRDTVTGRGLEGYRKHQGIYAYTRSTLADLTAREPSPLELDEGLEQLRALQDGIDIRVLDSDFRSLGVDTPQDLERVARILTEA